MTQDFVAQKTQKKTFNKNYMSNKIKRSDELTDPERGLLAPYLSDVNANVFTLDNFNPEVIGGALARYSRAPTGFKETVVREFLNPDGTPNDVKGSDDRSGC